VSGSADPTLSCVILTMGTRPTELARAIASAEPLRAEGVELVLVSNGADLPSVPDEVVTVRLPDNRGAPAGRNAGVAASSGEVVMFLDDDAWFRDPGIAKHVAGRFAMDSLLAVLQFRVIDPAGGPGVRWHVPRLRAGDPGRSSAVGTFVAAGFAARKSAYLEVGGMPAGFFFAHEETDLAWQLIERGYSLYYDAAAHIYHLPVPNSRHGFWYRYDGRNRVLLARRNLPWPLAGMYLLDWFLITMLRRREPGARSAWLRGFAEGWRADPGQRRPISLRSVWRLTRLGYPPIV
jgi:GT2 family glycosyltransferase